MRNVGLLTGDLVLGVLLAVLALAVGSAGLGYVDLRYAISICTSIEFWFSPICWFVRQCVTRVSVAVASI